MPIQLSRTNISLTGNACISCDLINDNIDNVKLLPLIGDNVNNNLNINLYSDTYSDNISSFYAKNINNFWTPFLDTQYTSTNPLYNYNNLYPQQRVTYCEYGASRTSHRIHNKQMELFVPFYFTGIADFPRGVSISITHVSSTGSETYISSRLIMFDTTTLLGKYLHRSFGDITTENIIQVGVNNSTISGISIQRGGNINVKNDIGEILSSRDMLFQENNQYICDTFQKNNIIIANLINFKVFFNISDIAGEFVLQDTTFSGGRFKINAQLLDNELLPSGIADMDFNHMMTVINELTTETSSVGLGEIGNIFNYNHEYNIREVLDNSKEYLMPKISKWSVSTDNNYIFNLYGGYSEFIDRGTLISNKTYNIDQYTTFADSTKYNLEWFNYEKLTGGNFQSIAALGDKLMSYNNYESVKNNICFYNGVKFDLSLLNLPGDILKFAVLVIGAYNNSAEFKGRYYHYNTISKTVVFCIYDYFGEITDIKGLYLSNNISNLVLGNFIRELPNVPFKNIGLVKNDKELNKCIIITNTIKIYNPIYTIPEKDGTYKPVFINEISQHYLYRYSGWIIPTFVKIESDKKTSTHNFIWYKNYEAQNVKAVSYIDTKIQAFDDITGFSFPEVVPEYKHFWASVAYNLPTRIIIHNITSTDNYVVKSKSKISKLLKITNVDYIEYIYNLYDLTIDIDIDNQQGINDDYQIILTLK